MSRFERFIERYGIEYSRVDNKVHLELTSKNFEKMLKVLLWEEWWVVFREHEDQTKEVWLQGVQAGHEQTWKDFVEEMRKGWFKEMGGER